MTSSEMLKLKTCSRARMTKAFKAHALAFLLFLNLIASCQLRNSDPKIRIIARVNGVPISLNEFQINLNQILAGQDSIAPLNPKTLDQFKSRALNEAILMALIRQEGDRRFIKVPKEEIDSRLNNWKDSYPPGGFNDMLKRQQLTEDQVKKRIENQLWIERVSSEFSGNEILVSDEEMKRYYQQNSSQFVRPERLHALQIVVPTLEEANKLRQEIVSGVVTFESAARQYSLSPDASKGGDIGFFAKKEKIEAFDEAFSVPVGGISRPISSRYGVHLFKVLERQPRKQLALQDAKAELGKTLRRGKEAKIYREWALKQLKDSEIYCNETLFAAVGGAQ